jgi:hypothetical protein
VVARYSMWCVVDHILKNLPAVSRWMVSWICFVVGDMECIFI